MTDPLSITVSVLALLKTSVQVSLLVKQFCDEVSIVDATLAGVLSEVQGFQQVLESMKETFEQDDIKANLQATGHVGAHWKNLARALEDGTTTLLQLHTLLEAINKSTSLLDRPRRTLRLKNAAEQIAVYREQIKSYRAALQLSLSTVILWNQVTFQKSTEEIPEKILPTLDKLYDEFRSFGALLNAKIEKLESTVSNQSDEGDHELKKMSNLRECVRSAADVVSTTSSTLTAEMSDKVSVRNGSDFGDVFVKDNNEAMLRWMSSNTVYEFEDMDTPFPDPSETSTRVGTEYQSDSDSDIENEMMRALFNDGKKRKEKGDFKAAARLFRNCLTRFSSNASHASLTSLQNSSTCGFSKTELLQLLTDTYSLMESWSEAKVTMLEKLAITERHVGTKDQLYLWDTLILAGYLLKTGDYVEAHLQGRRCLRGFKKLGRPGYAGYEDCLDFLCQLCRLEGKQDEEEAYLALLGNHQRKVKESLSKSALLGSVDSDSGHISQGNSSSGVLVPKMPDAVEASRAEEPPRAAEEPPRAAEKPPRAIDVPNTEILRTLPALPRIGRSKEAVETPRKPQSVEASHDSKVIGARWTIRRDNEEVKASWERWEREQRAKDLPATPPGPIPYSRITSFDKDHSVKASQDLKDVDARENIRRPSEILQAKRKREERERLVRSPGSSFKPQERHSSEDHESHGETSLVHNTVSSSGHRVPIEDTSPVRHVSSPSGYQIPIGEVPISPPLRKGPVDPPQRKAPIPPTPPQPTVFPFAIYEPVVPYGVTDFNKMLYRIAAERGEKRGSKVRRTNLAFLTDYCKYYRLPPLQIKTGKGPSGWGCKISVPNNWNVLEYNHVTEEASRIAAVKQACLTHITMEAQERVVSFFENRDPFSDKEVYWPENNALQDTTGWRDSAPPTGSPYLCLFKCPTCSADLPSAEFSTHVEECKPVCLFKCPTCSADLPSAEFSTHVDECKPVCLVKCPTCFADVASAEFSTHVDECKPGAAEAASLLSSPQAAPSSLVLPGKTSARENSSDLFPSPFAEPSSPPERTYKSAVEVVGTWVCEACKPHYVQHFSAASCVECQTHRPRHVTLGNSFEKYLFFDYRNLSLPVSRRKNLIYDEDGEVAMSKKILLLGNTSCGKTHLASAWVQTNPTLLRGDSNRLRIFTKTVRKLALHIWVAAGTDIGRGMGTSNLIGTGCFSNVDIVLLCFDITEPDYLNVAENWNSLTQKYLPDVPKILVGCKRDRRDTVKEGQPMPLSPFAGDKIARKIHARAYYETSAETGEGIDGLSDAVTFLCLYEVPAPLRHSESSTPAPTTSKGKPTGFRKFLSRS